MFFTSLSFAQDKFELLQAAELEGALRNNRPVRILRTQVVLKQGNTTLYCDSAYQFIDNNELEAYGNTRITQGDSVTLTGDHLFYNSASKSLIVTSNVVLVDKTSTLTTNYLQYNLSTKQSFYSGGGKIVDATSTLVSQTGSYNSITKISTFKKNVKVSNPDFTLESDTMVFDNNTKIAYFKSQTKVVSKNGVIYANDGQYNTITKASDFRGRAKVENGVYILEGDTLIYNEITKIAICKQNVILTSIKENLIIEGDYAYNDGIKGYSLIKGNPLMKNISEKDTFFLKADTLITVNDSINHKKYMLAFHHVKLLRGSVNGICDSLCYNHIDSTIRMFRNPILWSGENQMLADSIWMQMENQKIKELNLRLNSFMVSQDTLKNFNQIRGKYMKVNFLDNKIQTLDVRGNSESLYFSLEGDTVVMGINKTLSTNLIAKFEDNHVKMINLIKKPEAKFIPEYELNEPDRRLKGFKWKISEKPLRKEFIREKKVTLPNVIKPKPIIKTPKKRKK